MEWINQLNQVVSYIEQHLEDEISYSEMEKMCHCSLPKLQQMFLTACGISVSEYIRNRRMTVAAEQLLNTDTKIIDLALKLGYDSPEAFTRAYRVFHGVTPSETRKTGTRETYFPISLQIHVYGGKYKVGSEAVMRFETERLIIRRFKTEDWKDLQEIAVTNAYSEFGDCDEQWPLDDDGVKDMCAYIAGENEIWAVEVKALKKVVCFINFNGINEKHSLNIGHVINLDYLGNDYEYEALKALYNYGFLELGVQDISATWTLADREKRMPLEKMGMKVVHTFMADKFRPNADGTVSQFEACRLVVTKHDWITHPVS